MFDCNWKFRNGFCRVSLFRELENVIYPAMISVRRLLTEREIVRTRCEIFMGIELNAGLGLYRNVENLSEYLVTYFFVKFATLNPNLF